MIHFCHEQEVVMARYDLSDEEWRIVEPLLPLPGRACGVWTTGGL